MHLDANVLQSDVLSNDLEHGFRQVRCCDRVTLFDEPETAASAAARNIKHATLGHMAERFLHQGHFRSVLALDALLVSRAASFV